MTTPVVVFITDPRHDLARTAAVIRRTGAALGAHRLLVQLRDKESAEPALLEAARVLREATLEVAALLVVNGPADAGARVARAVAADGLHLPSAGTASLAARVAEARALLGDAAFVTTAAHDDDDVRAASDAGATAALVSPIFATPGKGRPRGVAALAAAREVVDAARRKPRLLVYALGGVTAANAASCAEAGADGVAAIRALYDARDGDPAHDASRFGQPFLARPR